MIYKIIILNTIYGKSHGIHYYYILGERGPSGPPQNIILHIIFLFNIFISMKNILSNICPNVQVFCYSYFFIYFGMDIGITYIIF